MERYWKEIRAQHKTADVPILLKKKKPQKHPGPWRLSLWLTWGWEPPAVVPPSPKVWNLQVMQGTVWAVWETSSSCRSLHTWVLVSQSWEFLRFHGLKSVEKPIIREPLKIKDCWSHIYPSPIFFHLRALSLTTCCKTQALVQLWPDLHEQVRSDIED